MTLYYWRSNALANNGPGWIITEAESIEEAQENVRDTCELMWMGLPRTDRRGLDTFSAELEADIRADKTNVETILYIRGGND